MNAARPDDRSRRSWIGFHGQPYTLSLPTMRTMPLVTFGGLCSLLAPLAAYAAVVSVNFTNFWDADGELAPATTAGVVSAAYWNNINVGDPNIFGNTDLIDDTGAATTVGFTISNGNYVKWSGSPATGDSALAWAALRSSSGQQGATSTIQFTGLPAAFTSNGYEVLVYLTDPGWMSNMRQANTLTSAGFTTTTYYTAVQNYTDANPDAWLPSISVGAGVFDTGSYIRYTGLVDSTFSLVTTYTTADGTGASNDSGIAGIQIVAAVPEPGTLAALAGLLAAGTTLLGRRKS